MQDLINSSDLHDYFEEESRVLLKPRRIDATVVYSHPNCRCSLTMPFNAVISNERH